MILRTIGNLSVGLALLLYAIPLPMVVTASPTHDGGQSEAWGLIILLLLLWVCMAVALCMSVASGGLDWLTISRGSQYTLAAVTSIAMAVVTTLSGMLRHETADQIPWAMRPLVPFAWAMWIFPLAVAAFCVLTINPALGDNIPRLALRAPLGLAGGLSLLVSFGMLAQWFVSSQQQQAARVDTVVSEQSERLQRQMADLRGFDADTQFGSVLDFTNRYHDAKLRELALEKLRALPDLEERLATGLRSPWYSSVLIFLDAADAPDNQPLAEPARDAFLLQAKATRESLKEGGTFYATSFDFEGRLVLSVADKFRSYGVDYVPAIRAFRSALDEPHDSKIKFDCATRLDEWLAREAKRSK